MSVVVVLTPHGRRQTVRCQPNQTCMHILDEVCRKHDFSPSDYELIHHRRVLDLTLMFRFAGLPNNAQLEMQAATKQRSVDSAVTLMLQLECGRRVQGEFGPDATVAEIVRQLVPEGEAEKKPAEAAASSSSASSTEAVCVYMRTELWGERLTTTTLRSLGLTGGRAAMRLMYKDPEKLRVQANVSAPLPARPVVEAVDPPAVAKTQITSATPVSPTAEPIHSASVAATAADARAAAPSMDVDQPAADDNVPKSESPSPVERKKPKMDVDTHSSAAVVAAAEPPPPAAPPAVHVIGPRGAIVFSLDDVRMAGDVQVDDSFYDVSVNDLKVLLRDLRCQAHGQDDAPLLTAKMRELDESQRTLQRLARYKKTVIRVQFADRLVLQGTFGPVDRVADLRQWVSGFLRDEQQEFELFTTPPKEILPDDVTLVEANCVPTAVVHFSGADGTSARVLKEEFVAQMSTPSAAVLEASKYRGLHNEAGASPDDEEGAVGGSSSGPSVAANRHPHGGNFKSSTAASSSGEAKLPKWFKPIGK